MMRLVIILEVILLAIIGFLVARTGPFSELLPATPGETTVASGTVSGESRSDSTVHHTIVSLAREHRTSLERERLEDLALTIHNEANTVGVDPLLVAAIVAVESSFRTEAVSHAGAVGLMQLRPWVAEDVALRTDLEWNGRETLTHPEQNVRLGIRYYSELVERFDGDERLALVAYHRGPTRVTRQLQGRQTLPSRYADNVLGLYRDLRERKGVEPASRG